MEDNSEANLVAPAFALPYASKGFIAQYEGDYELADHWYQQALAREPGLVHANIQAPLPHIYLGNLGKAREVLHRAQQMIPGEPQLTACEGLILALRRKFQTRRRTRRRSRHFKTQRPPSPSLIHTAAEVSTLSAASLTKPSTN